VNPAFCFHQPSVLLSQGRANRDGLCDLVQCCIAFVVTLALTLSVPLAVLRSVAVHGGTIVVVAGSGLICLVDLSRTLRGGEAETISGFGFYQVLSLATGLLLLVAQWGALLESGSTAATTSVVSGLAAVVLLMTGATIRFLAIRELGDAFISGEESRDHAGVVTTGVFSVVRHPSETGLWFCLLGVLVGASAWHTAVVVLPVIAMLSSLRVIAEERCLLATHGDVYRDYCREVPRSIIFRLLFTIVGSKNVIER
jgi:protein-S-isoprenylcysteine O-methyltransferase Ste14